MNAAKSFEPLAARILGCLKGIATGDAIGKQTENLSRRNLDRWYPDGVRGFEGTPGTVIPRYAANARRQWRIAETTDDTERTIAVARAIVRDRAVHHVSVGRELLTCVKCVHPGVRSLWELHQSGDPAHVAGCHDGCGAAVRVAPVGILYRSSRLDEIVDAAREASISTHGGSLAIAAASATAAAVSAALDGASAPDISVHATRAATLSESRWPGLPGRRFATALDEVQNHVRQSDLNPETIAASCFPNTPLTIVPLALALATVLDSAERAILLAANIGGDSDSVASIAGGILGARRPQTVNAQWHAAVRRVNGQDLESLARELAALRS
jgi:ADP-ribosylglycohydrolase